MTSTTLAPTPTPAPEAARDGRAARGLLPVVLTATFVTTLDFFIVNVAIPSLQSDLHAGPSGVQWVVAGFGLALAAGLITAGRLGDRFGRRRIFALGLLLFTLSSAACGLAPSTGTLVAARVVQGLSAALMGPQVLAILRSGYTGAAQARAFGMYGLTMGIGAVLGQLIGGLLIRADLLGLGWRACFLINLPVGLVTLALVRRCVPESRAPGTTGLDLPGTALVTAALTALVLPLIQGQSAGWPLWTWCCLGGSAVLFALFALHQSRLATDPVVDPRLLRERAFTAGILTQLGFNLGQGSFFLVLAVYLQQGHGLSALGSGLLFTAIGGGYLITSTRVHRIAARLGRQTIALGTLGIALGLVLLAVTARQVGTAGSAWSLAPGLFVDGLGMGLVIAPLTGTVLTAVRPQLVGSASGVLATVQQVGNALGIALLGNLFYGSLGGGFSHAFVLCLLVLAALEVAVAGLAQRLPRG
ncbi:MFS transporter [Kitasatospora kifunensis]|uniref:EmrB/QacA subfamily drug resistance transporter n=1 Tax=Kitasatospora kifunensis TaxID=58351 RepID=A0A7W7R3Y4_KITKI|nr:MFS transporter [Kitasatospora kifunensis]MBB4924743.1 EmrB/QacA subfamily drug resistance transporter [Kitasatospora kifunensis]